MTVKPRGYFITLEGVDGTGKTTHINLLEDYLKERGIQILKTREPGGTGLGEVLRKVLLEEDVDCHGEVELLILFAARAQHLQSVLRPSLEAGIWVLCDRFTDATFAYQGGGRKISFNRIAQLEEFVQQGLQPDLTLLLDLPIEEGVVRAAERGSLADRFERLDFAFKKRVRQAYLKRQQENHDRIRLIDARGHIAEVQAAIRAEVKPLLSLQHLK